MKRAPKLHFVGIGGIGMSGIAEVFLNQGYGVSGSDLGDSESTRRLAGLGARIAIGHRAENVADAAVVVVSSAVRLDNPEVIEARVRRIPVIRRAEMLGELMRERVGIAVAGTHGKTTTTSMLATIMMEAGLDPTLVIGGRVDHLGGNAKLGQGKYVVVEADESDGSFLFLPAHYGIVTNIDNDHLDHFKTLEGIENAFVDFVAKLPFYGFAAVCLDDPGVRRCISRFSKPVVTFGESPDSDYRLSETRQGSRDSLLGSRFTIESKKHPGDFGAVEFELRVPGRHNVLNALGAIALAHGLGIAVPVMQAGLSQFRGVKRRFEIHGQNQKRKIAVVEDYGHHPAEIAATLAAAREWWKEGRVVAVFQPHRYSRTLHCADGFLSCFGNADQVWITEIYGAGEDPIPGVTGKGLAEAISARTIRKQEIRFGGSLEATEAEVRKSLRDGDLVVCLGAGTITRMAPQLALSLAGTS